MATYQNILVDKRDGIVTVTLNRPESLNAMTVDMGDEVSQLVQELKQDQDARVATGAYTIKDIPDGTYTVKVWHPKQAGTSQQVKVSGNIRQEQRR